MLPVAKLADTWPDRARLRRWYRAFHGVPTARYAVAAFAAPAVPVALAVAGVGSTAAGAVLALYLGTAAVTDLLWKRIPNWLTVAALGWAVGLHLLAAAGAPRVGLLPVEDSALGLAVCFGLMLAVYLVCRGGEGDVKLMAAVGALVGAWHGVEAVTFGYLAAGTVALPLLAGRRLGARGTAFQTPSLPMAPFFALGVLLTLHLPGG